MQSAVNPTHVLLGDRSFVAAAAPSDSVSRTLRTNRLAYLLLLMLCCVNVKKRSETKQKVLPTIVNNTSVLYADGQQ